MDKLDSPVALALMAKAKLVFENEGTFLSFPLSPIAYTKQQLGSVVEPPATNEAVLMQSEFARLVNLIPSGSIWPPPEENYLWNTYDEVLKGAKLASSIRSAEEEADYQKAFRYLHQVTADGLWEDTPAAKAYSQYKDAWFVAQQDYRVKKSAAETSTDPAVKQQWKQVEEPPLLEKIKSIESLWAANGFKVEVEEAKRIEAALGAKSAIQRWSEWSGMFNKELDSLTDTNNFRFMPSGFSPSNVLETGAWPKFTLTGDEAKKLIAQAPPELRARLNPQAVDLDIESLSFEYTSTVVMRPWLAPDLFKARFWRFYDSSKTLSNGQTPPAGMCPAYIAALVFARNLKIKLKPNSPRNDAVLNHIQVNKALKLGSFKVAIPPAAATTTQPAKRPHLRVLVAAPPAIPIKPVVAVKPVVKNLKTFMATPDLRVSDKTVPARATAMERFKALDFTRIKVSPTGRRPIIPPKLGEPPKPTAPATQADDQEVYIMAFICKRLPLSPNPDPSLKW